MAILTVLYHSNTGHTEKQSEAVERGAASVGGTDVQRLAVVGADIVAGRWSNKETSTRLLMSDAIIFGAPTAMGDVSGQMKCFMDSTSELFYPRAWANKIAAGFTSSFYPSGDKLHTLHTFVTFAMQHGMIWVGHNAARFEEWEPKRFKPSSVNRLGGWVGAMATSHPWESTELVPDEADLLVAFELGRRVSEATIRWTNGVASELAQPVALEGAR